MGEWWQSLAQELVLKTIPDDSLPLQVISDL
jgi:hypothetical protein